MDKVILILLAVLKNLPEIIELIEKVSNVDMDAPEAISRAPSSSSDKSDHEKNATEYGLREVIEMLPCPACEEGHMVCDSYDLLIKGPHLIIDMPKNRKTSLSTNLGDVKRPYWFAHTCSVCGYHGNFSTVYPRVKKVVDKPTAQDEDVNGTTK